MVCVCYLNVVCFGVLFKLIVLFFFCIFRLWILFNCRLTDSLCPWWSLNVHFSSDPSLLPPQRLASTASCTSGASILQRHSPESPTMTWAFNLPLMPNWRTTWPMWCLSSKVALAASRYTLTASHLGFSQHFLGAFRSMWWDNDGWSETCKKSYCLWSHSVVSLWKRQQRNFIHLFWSELNYFAGYPLSPLQRALGGQLFPFPYVVHGLEFCTGVKLRLEPTSYPCL